MGADRARFPGHRLLLVVEVVLAALASGGVTAAGAPADISVMTQNLYLGTGLTDAFSATSGSQLAAAGSQDWANVLASDFPARAGALADEIVRVRPDVVGLQEVTLWRDETPGDVMAEPAPDATDVALDFLAILERALRGRGVPYTTMAAPTGADLEYPRLTPGGGLSHLRITDRDALIVRSDVAQRATNPRAGHYAAQYSDRLLTGPVRSTRNWESIDYRPDPATTVRIFNTHLEVGGPDTGPTQDRQADELLAMIRASPYPVIALGDLNAPADGSDTRTYRKVTAVLRDVWRTGHPRDPGFTCCQTPSLADPIGREQVRIDLVLTSGNWPVSNVARIGVRPFRDAPPPLWVSDHFGVTARITLPPS